MGGLVLHGNVPMRQLDVSQPRTLLCFFLQLWRGIQWMLTWPGRRVHMCSLCVWSFLSCLAMVGGSVTYTRQNTHWNEWLLVTGERNVCGPVSRITLHNAYLPPWHQGFAFGCFSAHNEVLYDSLLISPANSAKINGWIRKLVKMHHVWRTQTAQVLNTFHKKTLIKRFCAILVCRAR